MDKKDLRRKILQLHYDLSDGNTVILVLRTEVGAALDMDFNSDEILGAIMYLQEKGFLKGQTNVQHTITSYGIDEVENDFPNLGGSTKVSDSSHELLQTLTEIDKALERAEKGTLLYEELQKIQHEAERVLNENLGKDTELWREFDRENTTTYWEKYPKSKYTSEKGRLPVWRGFIKRTLKEQGVKDNKKQSFIDKGKFFTARQILREILKNAKTRIDIQDNYVNIELLSILQEYVESNSKLSIRILTQKINPSFKSDLVAFEKEYGLCIETKTHANCHDRFIIIDGNQVFHSGHSFKDLGSKASLINTVENEEKKRFIDEFERWWKAGNIV